MNLFIGKKKKSASPATLTAWLMIAYVLLNNREGEHIYRFGDESRLAAEQDIEEYKLFTCNTARVFTTRSAEDKAALLTATVVNSGDSRFAELDGSTCQPATILFRRQSRRSDGPWSMTVAGALLAVTGLAVGAAMAERERLRIVARTREGRRLAMTNGVKLGPPFKLTDHQRKLAAKRMAAGESTRQIARDFNVSHNTIARLR